MADAEEVRGENRESEAPRYAVSPLNGARIPLGAHPQNRGGVPGRSGRRPGWATEACRSAFVERIPRLAQIADGARRADGATVADEMRAIDLLGRYGEGSRIDASEVRDGLAETLDVLRSQLEPETYDRLVDLIRPIWTRHTHRRTR